MNIGLFPGQGAQQKEMGKKFFENFASVRARFEEASDTLGLNFKTLIFDDPHDELIRTAFTQPAVLLVSTAVAEVFAKETEINFSFALGHSLGEYSLLVNNGYLSFTEGLRLVRRRGEVMERNAPKHSGMVVLLNFEPAALNVFIQGHPGDFYAANDNAPGQLVCAGTETGLAACEAALAQGQLGKRARAIRLNVRVPFHSPLMNAAAEIFRPELTKLITTPRTLGVPFIANFSADWIRPAHTEKIPAVLDSQFNHPVQFRQSMERLNQEMFTAPLHPDEATSAPPVRWIEFAPGKTLLGFIKRGIQMESRKHQLVAIETPEDLLNFQKEQ